MSVLPAKSERLFPTYLFLRGHVPGKLTMLTVLFRSDSFGAATCGLFVLGALPPSVGLADSPTNRLRLLETIIFDIRSEARFCSSCETGGDPSNRIGDPGPKRVALVSMPTGDAATGEGRPGPGDCTGERGRRGLGRPAGAERLLSDGVDGRGHV